MWLGGFNWTSWSFNDEGLLLHLPRDNACRTTYCSIGAVQWLDDQRISLATGEVLPICINLTAPVSKRIPCGDPLSELVCLTTSPQLREIYPKQTSCYTGNTSTTQANAHTLTLALPAAGVATPGDPWPCFSKSESLMQFQLPQLALQAMQKRYANG